MQTISQSCEASSSRSLWQTMHFSLPWYTYLPHTLGILLLCTHCFLRAGRGGIFSLLFYDIEIIHHFFHSEISNLWVTSGKYLTPRTEDHLPCLQFLQFGEIMSWLPCRSLRQMHLPSDNILSFLWRLLPCEALRFTNTQVSLRRRSAHHVGRKGQPACTLRENQNCRLQCISGCQDFRARWIKGLLQVLWRSAPWAEEDSQVLGLLRDPREHTKCGTS